MTLKVGLPEPTPLPLSFGGSFVAFECFRMTSEGNLPAPALMLLESGSTLTTFPPKLTGYSIISNMYANCSETLAVTTVDMRNETHHAEPVG